jgi:magnesium-transporting ATPase (P-type)
MKSEPKGRFAIIIDGETLAILLANDKQAIVFRDMSMKCEAVLCCRMTPAQKAQVNSTFTSIYTLKRDYLKLFI